MPPSWRGEPGTTYQSWSFDDGSNPAAPEVSSNAYGTGLADITVNIMGSGWQTQLPGMGTQTNYWDLGGANPEYPPGGGMVLSVPNASTPADYQEIWVQVTYYRDINQAPAVSVPGAQYISGETQTAEVVPTGGSWMVDRTLWRIEPNPGNIQVLLGASPAWGSVIDQVIIDTLVPEPASALTLCILMAGFVVRRRRTVA
jgi:hypothetical protein